ncbi:MAG TPA: TolC family protein [Azospirillaceae bacterium]|nr:TolC family protein [Azospirillaceae bacterium]
MGRNRYLAAGMLAITLATPAASGIAADDPAGYMAPATAMSKAVTLGTALADLLRRHPQIEAARSGVEAAEHARGAAWAGYLPALSVSGDSGYERVSSPQTRLQAGGPDAVRRNSATARVSQPLFDGFRAGATLEQARTAVDLARAGGDTTVQTVLLEGATVFNEVLRQARLVQLAVENEQRIQQQLNLEDERVQRGSGIAVDVLQAKARLQIARERRTAFEGALREAVVRYRQVFDVSPDIGVMIDPQLPPDLIPAELDRAKRAAEAGNPVLETAARQVDLAEARKRAVAASYYPKLDLVAEARWEDDVDGVEGIRRDRSILLVATWELTDGLFAVARTAQASAELAATRSNRVHVSRKVQEETEMAWQALETARKRQSLLANAVGIAGEVLDARRTLRDAGKETALNVLDAESELYAARISEVSAAFDAKLAELRLLAVMGELERLARAAP